MPILRSAERPRRSPISFGRGIAIAFAVSVVAVYGFATAGHGTEACKRSGVEREAYWFGPIWFHSAIDDAGRAKWGWTGIPACAEHS